MKNTLRKLLYRAARSYVAGPELSDAIAFARRLDGQGQSSTIAYWNGIDEDPAAVLACYLAAVDAAADAGTTTYLSIKTPALGMNPASVETIARRCIERRVGLHFDSLALEHQAPTFEFIRKLQGTGATIGCTLPGRFKRSIDDVEFAVAHGLRVRVVKGQWADPVHAIDSRAGFMAVVAQLAGKAAHVSIATHDPDLASEALQLLKARGTPADLELLLGLPVRRVMEVARPLHVPVRMYVPYGYAWLPYSLAAARANPRILLWILGDALRGAAVHPGPQQ